jgi:hypothetical protein
MMAKQWSGEVAEPAKNEAGIDEDLGLLSAPAANHGRSSRRMTVADTCRDLLCLRSWSVLFLASLYDYRGRLLVLGRALKQAPRVGPGRSPKLLADIDRARTEFGEHGAIAGIPQITGAEEPVAMEVMSEVTEVMAAEVTTEVTAVATRRAVSGSGGRERNNGAEGECQFAKHV